MSTFIDLHVIQNVAPSCLNRDDTGAPKDCIFGGHRRSRISSQCLKRAARLRFASSGLLTPDQLAIRTRNIVALISERLAEKGHDDSATAIANALAAVELGVKARAEHAPQTEYLLFLSNTVVDQLTDLIADNLADLKSNKVSAALKKEIVALMSSANAVDVALFGRMVADKKDLSVDAAAQVAHAISANRVDRESDFFTAVDDWTRADEADAGMLGSVEFNSSCLYRFATVNLDLLVSNLGGDRDLALKGLVAFLRASILAIPTGKQNTFAAHNLPSAVAIGVHNSQPISLANAIEKPVWHGEHPNGLAAASVVRLQKHVAVLTSAYGLDLGLQVMDTTGAWDGDTIATLDELINATITAVEGAS
jgi:CRISPR system Cascade subunit CasC